MMVPEGMLLSRFLAGPGGTVTVDTVESISPGVVMFYPSRCLVVYVFEDGDDTDGCLRDSEY